MGEKNLNKSRPLAVSSSGHCSFSSFCCGLFSIFFFFLRKACSTSERRPGDRLPSFPAFLCQGCSFLVVLHPCSCCGCQGALVLLKQHLRAQHQAPHKHREPAFHPNIGHTGNLRISIISLLRFNFCLQCIFNEYEEKNNTDKCRLAFRQTSQKVVCA